MQQTDLDRFRQLCEGLSRPEAYPEPLDPGGVERIETHISVVFLAGEHAYKLKKPLDLAFLDFTDPQRRRHFCEEEIRLNRRTAPDIYLDTVPVTGTPEAPRIGGDDGEPMEWAVRMRRFPQQALLSSLASNLTGEQFDALGSMVAGFHEAADRRPPPRDAVAAAVTPALDNCRALADAVPARLVERVRAVEAWTQRTADELGPVFRRREAEGLVRECHGDLHLNNLLFRDGRFQAFDAIEFDPALRWIDTMSDLAFLLMDLDHAGLSGGARRVLNEYLEQTGDYDGLTMLRFFLTYRAMVRAKVAALRSAPGAASEVAGYLDLATRYIEPTHPVLAVTGGASGTGKSTLARSLVEAAGFIRLRSDVERKRLAGVDRGERRNTGVGRDLYGPRMSHLTYERLATLARGLLRAGWPVVVDAAFLKADRRRRFHALARAEGVPFRLLWLEMPEARLRARVRARARAGTDASDADEAVLQHQLDTLDAPDEVPSGELLRNPGRRELDRLAALVRGDGDAHGVD